MEPEAKPCPALSYIKLPFACLKIEFLEFFQFTYHVLSEPGRSDAAGAEQEKAKNALKRPISS
jgi:hypothetical protein